MRTLSYSPSIEAYAAVSSNGSVSYYDLTQDVTSCTVHRQVDGASTFTLHLANRKHKYNDLFTPMDRVALVANKNGDRTQLIAGYITSVPKFTLFTEDATISGSDCIYRLQRLMFDPGLTASQQAEGVGQSGWSFDTQLYSLLVDVAGMSASNVRIGAVPDSVTLWAQKVYAAQQTDLADSEKIMSDFYNVLVTTGFAVSGSSSSSTDTATTAGSSSGTSSSANAKQKAVVDACSTVPSPGSGLCAAWVYYVFAKVSSTTGFSPVGLGSAKEYCNRFCNSSDDADLRVGMIIAVTSTMRGNSAGAVYGHIGIYVGNSNVIGNNSGTVATLSLSTWKSRYGSVATPRWGWMNGVDLTK